MNTVRAGVSLKFGRGKVKPAIVATEVPVQFTINSPTKIPSNSTGIIDIIPAK